MYTINPEIDLQRTGEKKSLQLKNFCVIYELLVKPKSEL